MRWPLLSSARMKPINTPYAGHKIAYRRVLSEKSRYEPCQYFQIRYSNNVIAIHIPQPLKRIPHQMDWEKVRS